MLKDWLDKFRAPQAAQFVITDSQIKAEPKPINFSRWENVDFFRLTEEDKASNFSFLYIETKTWLPPETDECMPTTTNYGEAGGVQVLDSRFDQAEGWILLLRIRQETLFCIERKFSNCMSNCSIEQWYYALSAKKLLKVACKKHYISTLDHSAMPSPYSYVDDVINY